MQHIIWRGEIDEIRIVRGGKAQACFPERAAKRLNVLVLEFGCVPLVGIFREELHGLALMSLRDQ
jgi:hypothetical protein